MPSRLIIRTVNRNTPSKGPEPARWLEVRSRPSMSPFMCRPARHMWTVIEATETAATMASGPPATPGWRHDRAGSRRRR